MNRREFTRVCSSMVATAIAAGNIPAARASGEKTSYTKTLLQSADKQPLTPESLVTGEPYLFFYPFISTPCFLIDLGSSATAGESNLNDKDGNSYEWQGGAGPENSLVAYSAICTHKMSHPAREISFINYRHDPVSYFSKQGKSEERAQVISCCSERSVYDPADGARVLAGPASQPLAAIELEYDQSTGALYATGSYGGDMYDRFFDKFGFRAAIEHKVGDPKKLAGKSTVVRKVADYSSQIIKC